MTPVETLHGRQQLCLKLPSALDCKRTYTVFEFGGLVSSATHTLKRIIQYTAIWVIKKKHNLLLMLCLFRLKHANKSTTHTAPEINLGLATNYLFWSTSRLDIMHSESNRNICSIAVSGQHTGFFFFFNKSVFTLYKCAGKGTGHYTVSRLCRLQGNFIFPTMWNLNFPTRVPHP